MRRYRGGVAGRATALAAVACTALVCGVQAAPAAADPARVGEWRFDEGGGQAAVDSGPNGLDGQLGASAQPDPADPARIAGASGGALSFDGASFVRLPDRPELDVQALTAEAVVRAPSNPGAWRYIVSRGGQGCYAGSYGLYTAAAAGIAVYVFDGSRYIVSATARPADVWDGAWHHVAGTFDGRSLMLYVDGSPVGSPIAAPSPIEYASTSVGAYFGRFVGGCNLEFRGDLDLVRLWSGALSADTVTAAANRELPGGAIPVAALPAAAPPTIIPSTPRDTEPATDPNADARGCALRLSRRRVAATRRALVRVRVVQRGRPLRATRVVAKRPGGTRALVAARTGTAGWARLVFDARRLTRVRISAPRTTSCASVQIRVERAR